MPTIIAVEKILAGIFSFGSQIIQILRG